MYSVNKTVFENLKKIFNHLYQSVDNNERRCEFFDILSILKQF